MVTNLNSGRFLGVSRGTPATLCLDYVQLAEVGVVAAWSRGIT